MYLEAGCAGSARAGGNSPPSPGLDSIRFDSIRKARSLLGWAPCCTSIHRFDSNSSNGSNALWPSPGALRALRGSVGKLIEQCEAGEHAMRASEFCASLHALRKAVERLAATPLLPA